MKKTLNDKICSLVVFIRIIHVEIRKSLTQVDKNIYFLNLKLQHFIKKPESLFARLFFSFSIRRCK